MTSSAPADARPDSAARPQWLLECIKLGQNYAISKQDPRAHNLRNLAALGGLLLIAAGILAAAPLVPPLVYIPCAALGLGWVFFALLTLVVHEAAHGMFLLHARPAMRRQLNHWCGTCCCVPFAISYRRHWERGHRIHHRQPMTLADPQRFNARTGPRFWTLTLCLLCVPGFAYVERLFFPTNRQRGVTGGDTVRSFALFWLVAGGATAWLVSPAALWAELWGLQVLSALNQLKGALEHGGAIAEDANPLFRSRSTLLPLRSLILPFNISLHFEHHLNYSVPWYRLQAYHEAVQALLPSSARERFINRRVLAQLNGALP